MTVFTKKPLTLFYILEMGTSSSAQPKHTDHVVIVGGGYAGAQLATLLDGYCDVTLIDPKDAFHHCVASLRSLVEPRVIKKTLIPFEGSWKHSTFQCSKVVSSNVSLKKVTLSGDKELSYDFLVFACGSSVPFPGNTLTYCLFTWWPCISLDLAN